MSDDDIFDPDELASMAQRFAEIVANEEEGFQMIFYISHNDVEDLLEHYRMALRGDPVGMRRCWIEYEKIMLALGEAVEEMRNENNS